MRTLRYRPRGDEAVAATVGTVLMVVITVAMMSVIGLYLFGLLTFPEDPPTYESYETRLNGRWSFHFSQASESEPISDFDVVCFRSNGSLMEYDSDGDMVPDTVLSLNLADVAKTSVAGPSLVPVAYLDTNGNGMVDTGDTLIAFEQYVPPTKILADADRGYKTVGLPPDDLPLDSDLVIGVNPTTLGYGGIVPGDAVEVRVKHGGTTEAVVNGVFDANKEFVATVYMDPAWPQGNYRAVITVRPGAPDEWSDDFQFKGSAPDPITPEERAAYDSAYRAFEKGDRLLLVHRPSDSIVRTFEL